MADGTGPPALPSGLAAWRDAEQRYLANDYDGTGYPGELLVHRGAAPALVTACHAVSHVRRARRKRADAGTGGLAETVAAFVDASVVTMRGACDGDPNWDGDDSRFKQALHPLLDARPFVVDLHGMSNRYGLDVCIGTGPTGRTGSHRLAELALREAAGTGLVAAVNRPFRGARPSTVTAFVHQRGCPGIQVEVARRCRDLDGGDDAPGRLLRWLVQVLDSATRDGPVQPRG